MGSACAVQRKMKTVTAILGYLILPYVHVTKVPADNFMKYNTKHTPNKRSILNSISEKDKSRQLNSDISNLFQIYHLFQMSLFNCILLSFSNFEFHDGPLMPGYALFYTTVSIIMAYWMF